MSTALTELQSSTEHAELRPFHVSFSDAELADLRRRIKATRWPERETVPDASQGVQLATAQALARYWATEHDWRKCEAKTQRLPAIHHQDRRARHSFHPRALEARRMRCRMIVTHGWPGSIIEQMKIIEPLTDPTAYGGSASDASTS